MSGFGGPFQPPTFSQINPQSFYNNPNPNLINPNILNNNLINNPSDLLQNFTSPNNLYNNDPNLYLQRQNIPQNNMPYISTSPSINEELDCLSAAQLVLRKIAVISVLQTTNMTKNLSSSVFPFEISIGLFTLKQLPTETTYHSLITIEELPINHFQCMSQGFSNFLEDLSSIDTREKSQAKIWKDICEFLSIKKDPPLIFAKSRYSVISSLRWIAARSGGIQSPEELVNSLGPIREIETLFIKIYSIAKIPITTSEICKIFTSGAETKVDKCSFHKGRNCKCAFALCKGLVYEIYQALHAITQS